VARLESVSRSLREPAFASRRKGGDPAVIFSEDLDRSLRIEVVGVAQKPI